MRTLCTALAGLALAACAGDDEKLVAPSDAAVQSPTPDVSIDSSGHADAGSRVDSGLPDVSASVDAEAGSETGAEPDSGASDASPDEAGDDDDAGTIGPAVWLAYSVLTGSVRTGNKAEVWAARVVKGRVKPPVLVSPPGTEARFLSWSSDGRLLFVPIEGSQERMVIDMSGTAPGTVRRWSPAGPYQAPTHASPDGRYLAYFGATNQLTVVDLREQQLTNRSVEFCPSACPPATRPITPPRILHWTADSQWIYAHDYNSIIWGVRVVNGIPEPPVILANYASTPQHFGGIYPGPLGSRAAVNIHDAVLLSDAGRPDAGPSYVGMLTPTSFELVTGGAIGSSFSSWLSNGEFVFLGVPPDAGSAPEGHYLGNSLLWGLDTLDAMVRESKFAPDLRTLSYLQHDYTHSLKSLCLRRRMDPSNPSTQRWSQPIVAFTDYVDGYEWAPDSRHLFYVSGGRLYIADTAGPTLAAPREIESAAVAVGREIAWGRVSNRIFYTSPSGGYDGVRYIDAREIPRPPVLLTPPFTHGQYTQGFVRWSVSPEDAYVAYKGEFTRLGETGLYVVSVAGSAPEASQRVDQPALRDDEHRVVFEFQWQPVVPAP